MRPLSPRCAPSARDPGRETPGPEQGFSPVKTPSSDSEHFTANHVGANLPFVFL